MSDEQERNRMDGNHGDEAELDQLATELRAACPEPALSPDFLAGLQERLRSRWTLGGAMDRDPLLRIAAGLLVMSLVGAPVAALVTLWPGWQADRVEIGFEGPAEVPDIEHVPAEPDAQQVTPPDGWADAYFTPEWRRSLERSNRLALAEMSWQELGAAAPQTDSEAPADWANADADALWQELLRRCASGDARPPQPELEARVRELASDPQVGAWLWILDGTPQPAAQSWQGAPFEAAR